MLQRIISRLGHDTVEPGADTERTMGFGNTIMVWLAANMVVTTLLRGTLFIPGLPYLQAIVIILLGAALALYWTRISPLALGATVPVFVLTFVLYLAIRFAADRTTKHQTAETARRAG